MDLMAERFGKRHEGDGGRCGGVTAFCLSVCCALQGLSVFSFFPSLRDAFSGRAIYHVDFPIYHFFHEMTKAFFADTGTLNGYVPLFMSGYVQTYDFNGFLQILDLLLPWVPTWVFLRGALFLLVIGFPLVMYGILRLFGVLPVASAVGTVLSLALFHGSLLSVTTFFGMMNAQWVLLLSLFGLAALHRAMTQGGVFWWGMVTLSAALALAAHKTAVITFGLPCLVAAVLQLRGPGGWRVLGLLSVAWGGAFLVNLGWILNLFSLRGTMLTPKEWIDPSPSFILRDLLGWGGLSPYSICGWSGPLKSLLLLGGLAGAVVAWRGKDRTAVRIAGGGGFALFVLSYFGSCWSVSRLTQPIRYQPEVFLVAIVCLSLGLRPWAVRSRRTLSVTAVVLLLMVGTLVVRTQTAFGGSSPRARMSLDADVSALLTWIMERTDRAHRILMEDAYGQDVPPRPEPSPFSDAHLMPVLALGTKRAFAGGFQPSYYYQYRHVSLSDGELLGCPVGDVSVERWTDLIRDYNLGWCIVWSKASTAALQRLDGLFEDVAEIGRFRCFQVRKAPSWFLEGTGELDFGVNRLRLSQVVPGENGVLLSFHWSPSLQAQVPARIVPQRVGDDPVPFIRVLDPPRDLEIRHSGRMFCNGSPQGDGRRVSGDNAR